MIIPVANNLTNFSQNSYLSSSVASGAGTINVVNINVFDVGKAIQIGNTGEDRAEIVMPGTVSGTSVVYAGTNRFDHPINTPIYAINYDQLVIKKSSSGTAGTATAITNGTISIEPNQPFTNYDDTVGLSTDAYKVAFRNSTSGVVTSDSDWITPSGYAFYQLGSMRQRVKDKLRNASFIGDDYIINDWLNEWLEQMTNAAIKVNQDYALGTVNIGFGTSGLGTITSNDFKTVRRVWTTYSGTEYKESTYLPIDEIYPNRTFDGSAPRHSYRGDTVIEFNPHSTAGTAQVIYTKLNPVLVNDGDYLPLSMRGYTKSFIDYALSQARAKDEKEALSYENKAQSSKADFITEITPRDQTGIQTTQIVTPIFGNISQYGY